mmetsp:Transcript_17690/g.29511  ORF Transcript_17690/g.29511 Transcript_17690/m.29511 type:complete len:272 (+) Transcript_17690:211-1026(+)
MLPTSDSSSATLLNDVPIAESSRPAIFASAAATAATAATIGVGSALPAIVAEERATDRTSTPTATRITTYASAQTAAAPRQPAATWRLMWNRNSTQLTVRARLLASFSRNSACSLTGHGCVAGTDERAAYFACTILLMLQLMLLCRLSASFCTASRRTGRADGEASRSSNSVESTSRAMRRNVEPLEEPRTAVSASKGEAACAAWASAAAAASAGSNCALLASWAISRARALLAAGKPTPSASPPSSPLDGSFPLSFCACCCSMSISMRCH